MRVEPGSRAGAGPSSTRATRSFHGGEIRPLHRGLGADPSDPIRPGPVVLQSAGGVCVSSG